MMPVDEAGVVAAIQAATTPLRILGAGSKLPMLRPVQAPASLSTAGLTGITFYAPKELVLSARAGTPVADLVAATAAEGQHLIAEPPDWRRLLGTDAAGTLGGAVATNLSGPRRVAWGAMRDHVLGVRAVNGSGEVIRSGGRVLKNVTGLDLCKLLSGSHGTLAVMTEITLKVLPAPERRATLVLKGLAPVEAVAALAAALGSPYAVSAAAYLPATEAARIPALAWLGESVTLARLEDFAAARRPRQLRQRGNAGRRRQPGRLGRYRRCRAANRPGGRAMARLGPPLTRPGRARSGAGGLPGPGLPVLGRRPGLDRRPGNGGRA